MSPNLTYLDVYISSKSKCLDTCPQDLIRDTRIPLSIKHMK